MIGARLRAVAAARNRAGGATAREIDIPLPVKGLYSKADTAEVSGMVAAKLDNFRSDEVQLVLRRGVATGLADVLAVQRVPFEFGASPRYIDLRASQAESAGATYARAFNGEAMTAYISNNAIIADGLGLPIRYDGTTFQDALFTSADVNVGTLDGVVAHQDRPFFWKTNGKLEFYYGDLGAVQGAITKFPLDRLGNITGNLLTMASLTIDAGANSNDALAIFTTTGDVVVYTGNDPGDSNSWGSAIRFKIAPPVSRFALTQVGTDVWALTSAGIVSMADSTQRGTLALVSDISAAISQDILDSVKAGPAEWQLHGAADGSHIIVNRYTPTEQKQWIWEAASKAWSTARYPARRWHNLGLLTEFTDGMGRRCTIFGDADDNTEAITATWHTSFFRVGRSSQISYIRPSIIAKGPLTMKLAVLADHRDSLRRIAEAEQTITLEPDDPADSGGTVTLDDVIAVGAVGYTFQLRIEVTAAWLKIVNMKAGVV